MSTHYAAVLEVNKTANVEQVVDRYNTVTTPASRDVSEVARIVIRADSLETLSAKLAAHVDLIHE